MENSYKYFENRQCEYYPCHKCLEEINGLFCYCPMYQDDDCLGNPSYIEADGKPVKDCSKCAYPHRAENYEGIIKFLEEKH